MLTVPDSVNCVILEHTLRHKICIGSICRCVNERVVLTECVSCFPDGLQVHLLNTFFCWSSCNFFFFRLGLVVSAIASMQCFSVTVPCHDRFEFSWLMKQEIITYVLCFICYANVLLPHQNWRWRSVRGEVEREGKILKEVPKESHEAARQIKTDLCWRANNVSH
jgi:hypothetical protein